MGLERWASVEGGPLRKALSDWAVGSALTQLSGKMETATPGEAPWV